MTRREEPLFDPRLADWLEDDPNTAPDQALDVVLAAFPLIKQRRTRGVLFPQTRTSLRIGLAAAVVAIVAVGGLWAMGPRLNPSVGGPGEVPPSTSAPSATGGFDPTPSPSAASSAMLTFTSTVFGYTIDHPASFAARPATEPWPANQRVGNEEPWVDRFFAAQTGAFVGIASQILPADTSADAWMSNYADRLVDRHCGGPPSDWTGTTVNGVAGRRLAFTCDGYAAIEVVWVVGDRGWVITGVPSVVELMLPTLRAE
jgi:hypothetical protein